MLFKCYLSTCANSRYQALLSPSPKEPGYEANGNAYRREAQCIDLIIATKTIISNVSAQYVES